LFSAIVLKDGKTAQMGSFSFSAKVGRVIKIVWRFKKIILSL
jgi:hypothetical protein